MKERSNVLGRIDRALTMQLDEEINYWKNILIRVVVCVKALASRGLPFRGHDEKFGSIHNIPAPLPLPEIREIRQPARPTIPKINSNVWLLLRTIAYILAVKMQNAC